MSFLIDTNVLSERTRPLPHPGVIAWFNVTQDREIHISAVSFAELKRGIVRMASGARRLRLEMWLLNELMPRFEDRILPIDLGVAGEWANIVADRERNGRPITAMDAFIAATARVHGLTLVTRNTADFEGSVDSLLNPWREP